MHPTTSPREDELFHADGLPQLDASSLVDGERLEAEVTSMYRQVARGDVAELHFELGRGLAERLGAVLSNGVINLSRAKHRVFAEATRMLRPGGRLAIADIVSGRALKERTRRNGAACIAGAVPRGNYLAAIEACGFHVNELRTNDYRFASERALDACSTYEVESISLVAARTRARHRPESETEAGAR